MTVSSTTTRNSYTGDGTTTVFAYTFKIFDDDDITVILRTTATGTETVQTKTTDYSVSGVGDTGGGNITFGTPPTAAQTVVLLRQTAQTQTTDYTPNDPFPAASHEDALDKLTLIQQDQQDELDRAIKLSRTNTMTSTEFTVGASDRANKILAFDSSGELAVTQEIGTFTGDWASGTSYQQRDIIKDTSNDNIYIANTAHTSSGSEPISSNTDSAKWDLLVDAAAAATSASAAASSATAAAASATAAAASESAAATSETNAAASEAGVAADAAAAAASASAADTSATNASTSETNAAASASAASTSETNAATSATSASTSASAASTSASNAATSATNASNSASAASTSASNAATSETNAATSETNASNSASSASTSASNAATSAAAAEAAFDAFDDIYLGAKASAPTVDNDGDALTEGDQYFNTTNNTLFVWNGSAWQAASPDIVGDTTPQLGGNLDTNGNDITGTGDIDITGSVTATSTTGAQLEAKYATNQSLTITQSGGASLIKSRNGASDGEVYLMGGQSGKTRLKATTSGDISFYDSTGTTQGFFWDASTQRLGLGTTSPASVLHAVGYINSGLVNNSDNTKIGGISLYGATDNAARRSWAIKPESTFLGTLGIWVSSANNTEPTSGNQVVSIKSNGNVGIGTSSPSTNLEINGGTNNNIVRIVSTDANANIEFADNTTTSGLQIGASGDNMKFGISGTEAMRIDSSGNLLVGKTNNALANDGIVIRGGGELLATNTSDLSGNFNRLSTDGGIVGFYKDGTTVGVIGASSSDVYIGTGDTGFRFQDGSDAIVPFNTTTLAASDNVLSLGGGSSRFKDLYLSGGIYLGGTGSANYLDDYEEGTWTPSASSANGDAVVSTTIESATYTKVGNLVNVRCYITLTVTSVGTGNARITGLPFTNNGYYTPFTSTHETFAGSTGQGWVAPTSTRLEFLNANSTSTLSISGTGTKYAMISLTYKTDS
jgi:hypothetical protein